MFAYFSMPLQWNVFRYLADFSHLISVIILLYKMLTKRTCNGVSLKTHILYLIVFCARYINNQFFSPPLYNVLFKIFYIVSSATIVVLMLTKLYRTYEKRHDTFRNIFIIVLCAPLAYISMPFRSLTGFMFAYSLWVESFAIFPQLLLLKRSFRLDVINLEYIFFLGIYRLFYLLNWIYKMVTDSGRTPKVVWITGTLQTVIYSDFIYQYLKMKVTGTDIDLPL